MKLLAAIFASLSAISACNDSTTQVPFGGSANDATSAAAPSAPEITMLMKMGGGLHVSWTNVSKDCDTIVGERKADGDYETAFTVPGVADNKMDGALTGGTTYTYRLHCVRGGISSAFSNEMAGIP